MAIDTAAKRFAMLNAASGAVYPRLFEVDGAVDADDRAFLLRVYGGNAFAGATVFGVPRTIVLAARAVTTTLPARTRTVVVPSDAP